MSEHVRVEKRDGLLTITLARPERRNALTVAMYAALAEAVHAAGDDPESRAILFRGEGQDFAAGNDLADFLEAAPHAREELPVWKFLRNLARCPLPLIAAVHGNCVGIGTTMLLHCDLVVAEEGARFSMPFVDLGVVPEAGSSMLLPRLVGRRRAARHLLLAETFGVEDALAMGIISHRAATGDLDGATGKIVERLLAKPADALRDAQRLLRQGTTDEVLERMLLESAIFGKRLASPEAKQAISGFFTRRESQS